MKIELKKFNSHIGKLEYEMYQEIPKYENGAVNTAYNMTYDEFKEFIMDTIEEESTVFNMFSTPRITYILYIDDYPVGEIKIRPLLNQYWYERSGNIGYKIRPSERGKGYGNIILEEGLKIAREYSLTEVFVQCNKDNIISSKCILKNNGELILDENNILRYKITL